MNVLFVHDHKFRRYNGKLYSTGGLNDEVLNRYTKYADCVTVIARIIDVDSTEERWSQIKNPRVIIKGNNDFGYYNMQEEIQKCDKLIVRLPSILGIRVLEANKKIKKPYLIEVVGCAWDALWNHGLKGKLLAPYMFIKNKLAIKNASWVLYVTNEFLQKRYPTSGKWIGCSDVVIEQCDVSILEKRKEHIQMSKAPFVIGTIAAIDVKYKRQESVIKALGYLKKHGNTEFVYKMVGNGSPDYLIGVAKRENVLDQVQFVGGVPHDKVFLWLDGIDIYIQPSKQEGLPRALVEAMSRALPAIGSNVGGIPELLDNNFIFNSDNKDYLQIADLLLSMSLENMKLAAQQNFEKSQQFQVNVLDEKRDKFYKSFLLEK